MAVNRSSSGRERAMAKVLAGIEAGLSVEEACRKADRQVQSYYSWRKDFPEFRQAADEARARLEARVVNHGSMGYDPRKVPDFPEFCELVGLPMPRHQRRIWEVLNGETPDDLTPAMQLQWSGRQANNRAVVINVPPDHAKSATWSQLYVAWNIFKNPNVRIIIISQTEALAKDFVFTIQRYLIDPYWTELRKLDPPGGWKDDSLPWRANYFYVRGRTTADPDPTVQALGLGQQLYGRRCDILIADDIETMSNVGQYQKHAQYLAREASSRLRPPAEDGSDPGGLLLVLGTRVGPTDIYKYLRDEARDMEDQPGYTYFAQPAILENEFMHHSKWTVLWPERQHAGAIARHRSAYADTRQFQLIFQQSDISDDAPFPANAVDASISHGRFPGLMHPGNPAVRDQGMHGLHVVGGVDPATTGGTAMVILAADPRTMKRYVLDVFYERDVHAEKLIQTMKDLTERYGVKEWRVERNAFQRFLTQLETLKDYMNARGVLLTPHMTTQYTKWDEDWGVTTLIPLFMSCVEQTSEGHLVPRPKKDESGLDNPGAHLIELPSPRGNRGQGHEGTKALITQLKTWEPELSKHSPTDCVMALWFAEIAAREYLLGRRATTTSRRAGKFVTPYMRNQARSYPKEQYQMIRDAAAYGMGM
jgi:hypothetical protein